MLDAANADSTAQPGQTAVQQLRSGSPLGQRPTGLRAVEATASEVSDDMGHTQGQPLLCSSTGSRLLRCFDACVPLRGDNYVTAKVNAFSGFYSSHGREPREPMPETKKQ